MKEAVFRTKITADWLEVPYERQVFSEFLGLLALLWVRGMEAGWGKALQVGK